MEGQRHLDRTVVVTGGASGIGRGIALRFAEEGADVVVADVQRDPIAGKYFDTDATVPTDRLVEEEHGRDSLFVETDVSDPDAVEGLIAETVDEFGGLDVLVNNAGIFIPGTTQEVSIEDWRKVIDVNLEGQFLCAKFAIPHLQDSKGAIVNIGSVHAIDGGGGPSYPSSKAGVVNLTRDLAVELGPDEINVNAICPGPIGTPMQDSWSEEALEAQEDAVLVGGFGTPEDIGDAAVFLASDEASFITGESLFVDGGFTAYRGH
jgi:NAD(P)-dependent dehydrogenase (short-subunit alcohol dehydrogenase family)